MLLAPDGQGKANLDTSLRFRSNLCWNGEDIRNAAVQEKALDGLSYAFCVPSKHGELE